jgi:hypothetical protein
MTCIAASVESWTRAVLSVASDVLREQCSLYLLTAIIIDAYNDLADAAQEADAAVTDRVDVRGRWRAVARAASHLAPVVNR